MHVVRCCRAPFHAQSSLARRRRRRQRFPVDPEGDDVDVHFKQAAAVFGVHSGAEPGPSGGRLVQEPPLESRRTVSRLRSASTLRSSRRARLGGSAGADQRDALGPGPGRVTVEVLYGSDVFVFGKTPVAVRLNVPAPRRFPWKWCDGRWFPRIPRGRSGPLVVVAIIVVVAFLLCWRWQSGGDAVLYSPVTFLHAPHSATAVFTTVSNYTAPRLSANVDEAQLYLLHFAGGTGSAACTRKAAAAAALDGALGAAVLDAPSTPYTRGKSKARKSKHSIYHAHGEPHSDALMTMWERPYFSSRREAPPRTGHFRALALIRHSAALFTS